MHLTDHLEALKRMMFDESLPLQALGDCLLAYFYANPDLMFKGESVEDQGKFISTMIDPVLAKYEALDLIDSPVLIWVAEKSFVYGYAGLSSPGALLLLYYFTDVHLGGVLVREESGRTAVFRMAGVVKGEHEIH